jgi:hypothetical protein
VKQAGGQKSVQGFLFNWLNGKLIVGMENTEGRKDFGRKFINFSSSLNFVFEMHLRHPNEDAQKECSGERPGQRSGRKD